MNDDDDDDDGGGHSTTHCLVHWLNSSLTPLHSPSERTATENGTKSNRVRIIAENVKKMSSVFHNNHGSHISIINKYVAAYDSSCYYESIAF